jgi:hypothetical protein
MIFFFIAFVLLFILPAAAADGAQPLLHLSSQSFGRRSIAPVHISHTFSFGRARFDPRIRQTQILGRGKGEKLTPEAAAEGVTVHRR